MKRFLSTLTMASVAAVTIFVGNNAVCAPDEQPLDPVRSTVDRGSETPAQDASQKEAKGTATVKVNVDNEGIILKGYDAVAYFKQGKPVKGNPAIQTSYQGAKYLFASSTNKADFDKNPARYVPRYGAFCSYGVANGVLADVDGSDAFTIYKGKLYLCGNEGALKDFKTDIDSNIEKADANWRQLTAR